MAQPERAAAEMKRLALVAFIDVLFLVIYIFFLMPHSPADALADEMVPPGSVVVIAEWTPGLDVDVDLWVQAPDDKPVGYSNKGGLYFNLLRDDLGNHADTTPLNIEYSFTRGQPVGEYVVNVHLFSSKGAGAKVPVHVEILIRLRNGNSVVIFRRDVVLTYQGQEMTVQRFTLDLDSNIVGQSLIPVRLRSAGSTSRPGGGDYGG